MADIIQELRGLLAEERKALRDMKESGAPNDALLDAWLKASGRLNQASTAALPALLDRLDAAEKGGDVKEQCANLLKSAVAFGYEQPDGANQCEHGKFRWDDCIACYDEELMKVVDAIREVKP